MISRVRLQLKRHQLGHRAGRTATAPGSREKSQPADLLSLFPGEEKELVTPAGNCYVRDLCFPLDYLHGPGPLSELLTADGSGWELPARDERLREINPADSLFVDIETTSLGGGSGTWAFLIGAGWFEQNRFRLRQYFLRRLPEEKAMIHHFTRSLSTFPCLVTFNGKAFDLPIIRNRRIMTGSPNPAEPTFHVDLLHCSRRLYSARLGSCSLRSLEESLLSLRRQGDIPGEEIPAVYFDYLRRGKTSLLKQVFEHNALDILSMVSLLCRILKTVDQTRIDHPADYLSLGLLFRETGQIKKAIPCFEQASLAGDPAPAAKARWQLSLIYKQQRRFEEAVNEWERLIDCRPGFMAPYLEMAKIYEHQRRDPQEALKLTKAALALACRQGSRRLTGPQEIPALQHRKNRLERKIALLRADPENI